MVEAAVRQALLPFERKADAQAPEEGPYQVQEDLQKMMQRLVGIVRIEAEMQQSLDGIAELWKRARKVSVAGNREYNSGWHTALDLPNLLTVAEAITQSALRRKESRGAHFREDHSTKDAALGKMNLVVSKRPDGTMSIEQRPVAPDARRVTTDYRKNEITRLSLVCRHGRRSGKAKFLPSRVS